MFFTIKLYLPLNCLLILNWIVWNRTICIKIDLALNNLQRLTCHKTQTTKLSFVMSAVQLQIAYGICCYEVVTHLSTEQAHRFFNFEELLLLLEMDSRTRVQIMDEVCISLSCLCPRKGICPSFLALPSYE